jgi:uncharacterized protein DUF397
MDHLDSLTWRKSSYSGSNGGNCIEVATTGNTVAVRDGKEPRGPALAFDPQDWQRFTSKVKAAGL